MRMPTSKPELKLTMNTNRCNILCGGEQKGGKRDGEKGGDPSKQAFQMGAAHQEETVAVPAIGTIYDVLEKSESGN